MIALETTKMKNKTEPAPLWLLAWLEETLHTLKRPLTSDAWLGLGVK